MDNRQNQANINWYPGHMKKAKEEIKEKLKWIDIVIEVLDARMPLSSKIKDVDILIGTKPRILVFTKYDLCDKKKTDVFLEYYRKKGYIVCPCNLLNGVGVKDVLASCEKLFQKENEKRKEKGLKERSLRALVLGVPNVGKSTLINQLVSKKVASVGNRPGVTKNVGWIRVNKKIELLDTPGVLWPKLEDQEEAHILAVFASIKEEILDREDLALFALAHLEQSYQEALYTRYALKEGLSLEDKLNQIGKKRGALLRGGEVDYEKVYGIILKDLQTGAFGPITLDNTERVK